MPESQRKEWDKNLTPELRRHFEDAGQPVVEHDVLHRAYSKSGKHFAALAWLAEQRDKKDRQDTIRFWLIFCTALATLIATIIGMVVAMK